MSQPHLLSINSFDRVDKSRTTGNTTSNFIVNVPTLYDVETIELVSASIPNTVYNCVSQRIVFTELGTQYFANIPDGAYDINQLLLEIQDACTNTAATGIFTCIYIPYLFRLSLSSTVAYKIDEDNDLFGFIAGTPNTIHQAAYALKLHTPKSYVIRIKEFNYANATTTGNSHGNFIISSKVNSSYIDQYAKFIDYNQNQNYTSQAITQLTVTLLDDHNSILDLNGSDWNFTLRLTYKKTSCNGY